MRADRSYAYGAALGFLGDLVAGDPRRGHPVAAFGRAAGALERRMWRDDRLAGAVYAALCAGAAASAAGLAARTARRSPAASTALAAACTWAVLGGTSLAREARAVGAALEAGDLDAARARLPHLCGRDPQHLDAAGIARAVVESVAENTSDAVVGALVWGAAAGPAGLAGFRAANTLDAMVGHRSPRHLRFGWAAARLDDAVGWPGARLTAALAVLAGPHPRAAWRTWRRDAAAHPSPNAGPVEAAFSGALRIRLGGTLSYAGRTEHRAVLGAEFPPPGVADIERAIALSRRVSALALGLSVLPSLLSADAAGARGSRPRRTRRTDVSPLRRKEGAATSAPPAPQERSAAVGAGPARTPPRRREGVRAAVAPPAPRERRTAPVLLPPRRRERMRPAPPTPQERRTAAGAAPALLPPRRRERVRAAVAPPAPQPRRAATAEARALAPPRRREARTGGPAVPNAPRPGRRRGEAS